MKHYCLYVQTQRKKHSGVELVRRIHILGKNVCVEFKKEKLTLKVHSQLLSSQLVLKLSSVISYQSVF